MNGNSNDDETLLQAQIASAVAKVDPRQMAIFRRLTPAQRVEQAVSMMELVEASRPGTCATSPASC